MHPVSKNSLLLFFALTFCATAYAQTPAPATSPLHEIHFDGLKTLQEPQVIPLSGLEIGAQVGRDTLQSAADRLVQSGLFSKVNYNFQTPPSGVILTFRVEESPRIPAYFDNLPWFSDSELNDAIAKKLPFYKGTLPNGGTVLSQAADALSEFTEARGLGPIEHQIIGNPVGDGTVHQFHIEGAALQIAKMEFSDPALASSKVVQAHLPEIVGKPYSRIAIDVFLLEQIRPVYQRQGYLQAKLGPPEVRLTGDPNQKLPKEIPVFVPVVPGPLYHWKSVDWQGNSLISTVTLSATLHLKPGDVADGMAIEAGWDQIREDYAQRGYLDAAVDPAPAYDDQAHTVSYTVRINEGKPYHYGSMTITGLSATAEKRLRDSWPISAGEVFDKAKYEAFLLKLQTHHEEIFKDLPLHYDEVGHWLQTDAAKSTVDILLDFK
ncbi:MAG TPA: POTRA domain-containing protein [Candidatus Acidoferrum sp.]|jgi:outer membrane protein assembly factor BamA